MATHTTPFTTIMPQTLTICTYTEFAPFSYERDGQIVGTDIDLLRRFAEHYGLDVRLIAKPFSDLWLTPGSDLCDVAAAGIGARAERELGRTGVWSVPYMTVQRSLLIRKSDAGRLSSPPDFAGKKIVVTPDSAADIDAQERYLPLGAEIIAHVPSQDDVVRRLLGGEVDAFGEGDVSNAYLAAQYPDVHGEAQLVLADVHPMLPLETLHFAVRAADSRLVQCLNTFIDLDDA